MEEFQLTNQKGIVEALIFASAGPITLSQLAKTAKISKTSVESIISELNEEYINSRRSFRIEEVAEGYRMYTLPEFHPYINNAQIRERTQRLSPAALEALAVIAYKQPVTRGEIERIRGVDCGGVLKNLLIKNLAVIEGRSPAPGNPILYTTSEYFLEFFGLPSIDHLPPLTEIEEHDRSLPSLRLVRPGDKDSDNGDNPENDDGFINRLSEDALAAEPGEEDPRESDTASSVSSISDEDDDWQ